MRETVARLWGTSHMRSVVVLVLALGGCAANVTTTKITRHANGVVTIDSGKDVRIGALDYDDGVARLHVVDYSSAANTDAINAQAKREVDTINAVADAVIKALAAGAATAAKGGM